MISMFIFTLNILIITGLTHIKGTWKARTTTNPILHNNVLFTLCGHRWIINYYLLTLSGQTRSHSQEGNTLFCTESCSIVPLDQIFSTGLEKHTYVCI